MGVDEAAKADDLVATSETVASKEAAREDESKEASREEPAAAGTAGTLGPTTPSKLPLGLTALTRWLAANQVDLQIAISLVALCVAVRVLWLAPVDNWGDPALKWHFVRQWFYDNHFGHGVRWTHHMARLGINIPTFLVQAVFGHSVRVYYILPVAAYAVCTIFVYLLGKRMGGRAAGIWSALLLIYFRGMNRSTSQLLPDGIAAVPLLMATLCLFRFEDTEGRKRLHWLLGAAGSFIWLYAMKESNLLFAPGFALAIWLSRKSFKEVGIFTAVVAAYGAFETACFWLFTDYSSRMAIVQDAHGEKTVRFAELFDRFASLESTWQMLFWLWVPSACWLLGARDKRARLLVIPTVIFVLLITFMVRRIDPIVLWVTFKSRYFATPAPLWVLAIGLLFTELVRRAWAAHAASRWPSWPAFFERRAASLTFAACVGLGAFSFWLESDSLARNALVTERQLANVLNDAYRRNLPIIEEASKPRGLRTVYSIHMNPKYLAQARIAKPGELPDLYDALHIAERREQYSYLLRDAEVYGRNDLEKLIDADCAVRLRARGAKVVMRNESKLPEHCRAPRGEVLPR
jgi:Dolichyl-phosphate-mannose-protein mannosyltransferase